MKTIFLSGAHGSGCSFIKSQATGVNVLSPDTGTCHESWSYTQTQNHDRIIFFHHSDLDYIRSRYNPDITVWLQINPDNIEKLCQRIVVLDFLLVDGQTDWVWTLEKHNILAGPDWPAYSSNIKDYPAWCLAELMQVAYDRSAPWMQANNNFDYVIDSDELFGNSPPVTLKKFLTAINCKLDIDFLKTWQQKNESIYQENKHYFKL